MANKNPETPSDARTLGHTFHIVDEHAGFLRLGVRVQVIEKGKVIDEATVYGDTLNALRLHLEAENDYRLSHHFDAQGFLSMGADVATDRAHVLLTNDRLPKRFQRPHPVE